MMQRHWVVWARQELTSFRDDMRGVTAILFAAVALPLLGLGLAAVDYARAHSSKSAIQDAADAAVHAGAARLGNPQNEVEDAVRGYLKTNLPKDRSDLPFTLVFGPENSSLTVKLNTSVPTMMLGIVGVNSFQVTVESTAERPAAPPVIAPPHRGVTPDVPPEITKQLSQFGQNVSPDDLKQAEAMARQLLGELERNGGADVQQLLRSLGSMR